MVSGSCQLRIYEENDWYCRSCFNGPMNHNDMYCVLCNLARAPYTIFETPFSTEKSKDAKKYEAKTCFFWWCSREATSLHDTQ